MNRFFHILAYIVTVVVTVFCMALVSGVAFGWMQTLNLSSWLMVGAVTIGFGLVAVAICVTLYDMGDYENLED